MDYEESLRSLGLEEYIEVFHENNIDEESIFLLGEAELKELIPKIGPRIKFKKLLDKLKLESQLDLTLTTDTPVCKITKSVSAETSADEPSDSDIPVSSVAAQEHQNTRSLDGRALINEGQSCGGLLREGSRRKLSQIVINHSLENKPNSKISSEEFYRLASEIVTLFPKESKVVYYSAYRARKDGAVKKNASGKLYESYIFKRRKLRQSGELPGTSRSACSSRSTSTVSTTSENSDSNEPDDDDNLTFLINNVEPWEKVTTCWSATSTQRLKNLYKESKGGIHFQYPALKQPQGYTLLMKDFNQLYPQKENCLFSSIDRNKYNIINYAKHKAECTRDRNLKTNIQALIALIDEDDPESISNVCLVLLTCIINISPARKKKGKEIIKFSRSEMTSAFIHQVASEADVTPSIVKRKETLAAQQRTVQPYVIYVGENCTQIRASYVVINDTVYNFSKLITAVDCAFKIFHSTGACYPEECEDVWLFIQLGFFNINTKYDRNTQVVNSLMTDLGLICDI